MNIDIERVSSDTVENEEIELVERKCIGHPDSISDGIAEAVSRALCREYRERFGRILHHNTDEVQLVAGSSEPEFSGAGSENAAGGEMIDPIYILLAGRATKEFEDERIPVDTIALKAAKNYIDENFKVLDSDDIEFESRIGETSTDLKAVFESGSPKSNDTSFGVGHAPLSDTEKVVKNLEERLLEIDAAGEDIKIMGLRRGSMIKLTVAVASISSRVKDMDNYREFRNEVKNTAQEEAGEYTDLDVEVDVNTADEFDEDSVYLTVTGTSAEMGDDGSVGRGNRANGLITPNRPMSMEASSGKNPVTHVGKIYNLLANKLAGQIYDETGEFAEVRILSQIGAPIDEPQTVNIRTSADEETVNQIVDQGFEDISQVTDDVVEGRLNTF